MSDVSFMSFAEKTEETWKHTRWIIKDRDGKAEGELLGEIARRSVKYYIMTRSLADDNMFEPARYIYGSERETHKPVKYSHKTRERANGIKYDGMCLAAMCPLREQDTRNQRAQAPNRLEKHFRCGSVLLDSSRALSFRLDKGRKSSYKTPPKI